MWPNFCVNCVIVFAKMVSCLESISERYQGSLLLFNLDNLWVSFLPTDTTVSTLSLQACGTVKINNINCMQSTWLMSTNTQFLSFFLFHAPSVILLLYCTFEIKSHVNESLHFHTNLLPFVKCCGPFRFPWSLCNCTWPGSLALLQTQPSFSLLSPSTNLHRHKHGTTLATVFHLQETVTMVGGFVPLLHCSF